MTRNVRRTHGREPSARKQADEFEHLNLTPESRRLITGLHPRAKEKLLARLTELCESFRQFNASFSIPSFRVAAKVPIQVSARRGPTNQLMSVYLS